MFIGYGRCIGYGWLDSNGRASQWPFERLGRGMGHRFIRQRAKPSPPERERLYKQHQTTQNLRLEDDGFLFGRDPTCNCNSMTPQRVSSGRSMSMTVEVTVV